MEWDKHELLWDEMGQKNMSLGHACKLLLKNGTIDGYAYQACYYRVGFTLRGTPGTLDFCNIFRPSIGEDQKKVLPSESGAWHCATW